MTAEQIAGLGPAFTSYLDCFESCFVTRKTFGHLSTYCRGLLSDLARKSVEPVALAAGCAVRTLQEFLTHHRWDHDRLRDPLQRRVVQERLPAPGEADDLGIIGMAYPRRSGLPLQVADRPGADRTRPGQRRAV